MNGVWLCLRLVFGFGVVLVPGVIVARALGVRRAAAGVAWSLVLVFAALAVRGRLYRGERGRLYRDAAAWLGSGDVESLLTS